MIIFKQVVTGGAKYDFPNQPNLTIFDVHNDSPYNMGVSFGTDTGMDNADFYTSPHSILYGIGPVARQQRSIAGVRWNGTIYIYTETPMGGGTTNLASAPASQITVIGYATGYNPVGTTSLARMTNTGNPVNTVGGTSNSIQNDNNAAGTSIVEATVAGDGSSAVSWTNNAILVNGDAAHPGTVSFDNALVTTDGSGNITSVSFSGTWRSAVAGQGLINALNSIVAHVATYNANSLTPQSGGNNTGIALITRDSGGATHTALAVNPGATELQIFENAYISGSMTATGNAAVSGNATVTGTLGVTGNTTLGGVFMGNVTSSTGKVFGNGGWVWIDFSNNADFIITPNGGRFKINNASLQFTDGSLCNRIHGFSGTGSGTFNHNNGQTPNNVQLTCHALNSSQTMGYDSENGTTVHVTTGAGLAWQGIAFSLA